MTYTDEQLRGLFDERDIRSLNYRYCRAIDRRQFADLRMCYHPEATDHHGDFFVAGTDPQHPDRDNIVALRYIDDLERRSDEWRILRRVRAYEWTRTDAVADGWSLPVTFLLGRLDSDDIVYLPVLPTPGKSTPVPRAI